MLNSNPPRVPWSGCAYICVGLSTITLRTVIAKSGILKLTQNLRRRLVKCCSTKQEQRIVDSWLAVRGASARNFITVTKRRLRTRRVAIAQVYRYCCSCTPFHALRHCDDPQLDTASTQFSTRVSPIFPHTFASLPHPLNNIFSVPTNARICNLHEQTHCMMDTRSIHSLSLIHI